MTADIRLQVMSAITVKIVSMTIAHSVRPIARFAIRQSALDVVLNVQTVNNRYVNIAPLYVPNAKKQFVKIVLTKKAFAINVKKNERNKKMKKRKKKQENQKPMLRFSPTAWAKLLFMRDITDNEIGGFGITEADNLLFVTDFALVKQKVTSISISFEDESVADFFEDQVEAGRVPEQFARIWLHTHPGSSPEPSMTDENTFARVFGSCNWAIMFIVAQDGSTYARLRFNTGPGGEVKIPVCVDYNTEFDAADFDEWKTQYLDNVVEDDIFNLSGKSKKSKTAQPEEIGGFSCPEDLMEELELMHPSERQAFMDELAVRSDFWDESEVLYE